MLYFLNKVILVNYFDNHINKAAALLWKPDQNKLIAEQS